MYLVLRLASQVVAVLSMVALIHDAFETGTLTTPVQALIDVNDILLGYLTDWVHPYASAILLQLSQILEVKVQLYPHWKYFLTLFLLPMQWFATKGMSGEGFAKKLFASVVLIPSCVIGSALTGLIPLKSESILLSGLLAGVPFAFMLFAAGIYNSIRDQSNWSNIIFMPLAAMIIMLLITSILYLIPLINKTNVGLLAFCTIIFFYWCLIVTNDTDALTIKEEREAGEKLKRHALFDGGTFGCAVAAVFAVDFALKLA